MREDNESYQELEKFLLDIRCLDPLREWSEKFNLFDMLKISTAEIRHSNMLAWLLDPNGNHGMGDFLLRQLFQELVNQSQIQQDKVFQYLLMDLDSFTVLREYTTQKKRIDLLILSREKKVLICIENKVHSGEHDDQLSKYYELLEHEFSKYERIFVFLTPDGVRPEKEIDRERWCPLSYKRIVQLLEIAVGKNDLAPDVKTVISHYINAVGRDIVGDEKLEQLCQNIYKKHHRALDLLFQYRADSTKRTAESIKAWCREKANTGSGEILFDEVEMASKISEIAFTTPTMTRFLPDLDEPISGWNDRHMYHYAIYNRNDGKSFYIALIVAGRNLSEDQRRQAERLGKRINGGQRDSGWQWWTLKKWKPFEVNNELEGDAFQNEIFDALNHILNEIKAFEQKLQQSK